MGKYPKIVFTPPGPKAREILERDKKVVSPSFVRWYPLVAEGGHGAIVRDVDGNEYIDMNAGLAVLALGHSHPKVVEAVKKQAEKLIHYSNTDFYYEESVKLAEKLCSIMPGREKWKVFFGNSGAEAVEACFKSARWHSKKPRMLAFIGAFHGRTFGALSFTASKSVQRRYFAPLIPGVTHVPYPYCYRCPFNLKFPDCGYYCVGYIEDWVLKKYVPPEEVAGIIFEPIQGEGGYIVPPPGYFEELEKLSRKYGFIMIDDEVQAGMGRTGKWWAIEHWNVIPDMIASAKAIANGLPLGAAIMREKYMKWGAGSHASTFGGNPVSCAASLAVIETIEKEDILNHVRKVGEYLKKRLMEMMENFEIIGDVRGKGLMVGVELVKDRNSKEPAVKEAEEIIKNAWKRGVAIITAGISTLRFSPPLIIDEELIDSALDILEDVIREVTSGKR